MKGPCLSLASWPVKMKHREKRSSQERWGVYCPSSRTRPAVMVTQDTMEATYPARSQPRVKPVAATPDEVGAPLNQPCTEGPGAGVCQACREASASPQRQRGVQA